MMENDRWRRIEELYHAALERPPAAREAFLAESCGHDHDLRREVESLINLPAGAEAMFDRPAIDAAARTLAAALPAIPPPDIPGYRIIRELGEGGMGLVYLAEQQTPLQRLVALKLIRPGMDSLQILARFNAERQAMAMMDHPNIAGVFDAGTTRDGRPYFVMEYVDGVPITDYCDRERLSTTDRIELFRNVCTAVQHAHQKGLVHRDLKPSNVLVFRQDGRSVPKVIDFGTAKAVGPGSGNPLTLTAAGMVLGTIEYMSPEQAAFSRDIDTTTDVYSLGVMLYEMLVGVLPFERERPGPEGYDELRRLIRESDPPRPSTRLSSGLVDISGIAAARRTDPERLGRSLKGDLDWITLKALEKDRNRRYATVAAFARDLQRFLAHEPVEARPPSATYRLRKFTRRHRGAVVSGAALLTVLTSGLIVSTLLYIRAEQFGAEAIRARNAAESQRAVADQQRQAAEEATAAATAANREAERQGDRASKEAARAGDALRESELRNYVITINAADAEARTGNAATARQLLDAVPPAARGWEWHHLRLRADASLFTLGKPVTCATIQPRLVVESLHGAADGSRLFLLHCQALSEWKTDSLQLTVRTMPASARLVATDDSGRRLAGITDPTGTGWQVGLVQADQTVQPLGQAPAEPLCGAFSSDGSRAVVGYRPSRLPTGEPIQDTFDIWDLGTRRLLHRFQPPPPPLPDSRLPVFMTCSARFSPDGTLVATSGGTVRIWNAASGDERYVDSTQAAQAAQPFAFTADSRRIAIGRRTGLVDIIDLDRRSIRSLDANGAIKPLPLPETDERRSLVVSRSPDETRAVAFSGDGSILVSGLGKRVAVWDVQSGRLSQLFDGHSVPVAGIVYARGRVFSADVSGMVRAWDPKQPTGVRHLEGTYSMNNAAISQNGQTLVAAGVDGSIVAWRADAYVPEIVRAPLRPGVRDLVNLARTLQIDQEGRTIVAFSPSAGQQVLNRWTPGRSGAEQLPVDLGESPCSLPPNGVSGAALSANGRYLAYSVASCAMVMDLGTGRQVAALNLHHDGQIVQAGNIGFGTGDLLLLETNRGISRGALNIGEVVVWNWRSKTVLRRHTSSLRLTRIRTHASAGGARVAVSGLGPQLAVWNGDLSREISRIDVATQIFAISPDGRRLATTLSAVEDSTVKIWNVDTGQLLLTLFGTDSHRALAFTTNGNVIAGRTSGGFTIWETQRPACAGCPAR